MEAINITYPFLLVYPFPTVLVSCTDVSGKYNFLAVSWQTPLSFKPPLIGVSIGYKRYSYKLIHSTREFVINVMPYRLARVVLKAGRVSGTDINKFEELHLTPEPAIKVKTPLIRESMAAIECKVEKEVDVGDHALFVGRVVQTHINPFYYARDGTPILENIKPVLYAGKDVFCTISEKKEDFSKKGC